MTYAIGNRVKRLEGRPQVGGVVLDVAEGPEGMAYELSYDEGGSGWWPESSLEAEI
jgi:hypothetical protein